MQLLDQLQVLLACWVGACPTCQRPAHGGCGQQDHHGHRPEGSHEVLRKNDDAPGTKAWAVTTTGGRPPYRRSAPVLAIGRRAWGAYDPVVGYDVHLFRFQRGECVEVDAARLMELIQPPIVWSNEEFDHVRLRAPDGGEADLYGAGQDASVLLFSRWCVGGICELTAKLARELDMVIVPPDRPVMIIAERQRAHLPQDMAAEAVVVRTGTDLQPVIDPARRRWPASRPHTGSLVART